MLNLTIKEKERIGKLLKYYRKKNKIQWKEIEKIMSTSTYQKLENGYISKKDEIYEKVFDLYNFSHMNKENFEEWLHQYLIKMNDILEYYKEEQFDSLIQELEELAPYKNTIVYGIYYQVISYILNYYKYSKYMTLEELEDCLRLFEYFELEEILMIYLLEVMFISNNNRYANYDILERLFIEIAKIHHPITEYLSAVYYKCNGELETSLILFEKMIKHCEDNDYRKLKAFIGKFMIYKNIDKKKAIQLIGIFDNLKKENRVCPSTISSLNYNIGMFYYIDGMYEKAYPYFWENVENGEIKEFIFICAICTQLDLHIPDKINEMNDFESAYKLYLSYFKLKYLHKNNKELVEYIMQVLIPNKLVHNPYSQPFWKMFEEELTKISLKDRRYAIKLAEYIQKKKKVCGNN